jgi:hypothetical protein
MAPIELPQESSHPSHWTIDLYSTSLSVRFVSDQECTVDSGPPLDLFQSGGFAQRMTKQGRLGLWSYGCVGSLGAGVRLVASPAEGMFAGVNNRISVKNQGRPNEGTEVW